MYNGDVISMPDKWEYPWYAAWDLAFHVLALTLVDPDFGKHQLKLMLRERYMHPNGQLPAYEWNFGDVNPPVHAWAASSRTASKRETDEGDREWLKSCFQKLLLNFTWWVNRKDRTGRQRLRRGLPGPRQHRRVRPQRPCPTGGYLEQADGTAWMALFCQNMLEIAVELAMTDPDYGEMALKFVEHFLWIASAMAPPGRGHRACGTRRTASSTTSFGCPTAGPQRLKVRSMVGLLPLCAATTFDGDFSAKYPELGERFAWFLDARPEVYATIHDPRRPGVAGRRLAAILDETKLRRVLAKMLDEAEFLGPYGLRSLSRYHADHPYVIQAGGQEHRVSYLPAESDTGMFGGNSNWRGPVWMPVNVLIVRALWHYYLYYGDEFTVECPTGSGRRMNLDQ